MFWRWTDVLRVWSDMRVSNSFSFWVGYPFNIFVETIAPIFQDVLMNGSLKNIVKVFTVTFHQFNASMLNKRTTSTLQVCKIRINHPDPSLVFLSSYLIFVFIATSTFSLRDGAGMWEYRCSLCSSNTSLSLCLAGGSPTMHLHTHNSKCSHLNSQHSNGSHHFSRL